MFAIIFLILSFILGLLIANYFFKDVSQDSKIQLISAFIWGNYFSVWIIFLFSFIFSSFFMGVSLGILGIIIICLFLIVRDRKIIYLNKPSKLELLFFIVVFLFSLWIMEKTLSSPEIGIIKIGVDVWGDFESHLPLIRSFSWGNNLPPSSPAFPNQNLSYHFLFDFWSAILEFLGMPLTLAVNITSALSFTFLILLIYKLPQLIFRRSVLLGLISVALFLFNSSLGFWEAFNKIKPDHILELLVKIWQNDHYLSVGPFTNDHVSIFWNLNVYINQRHLIFSLSLALLLIAILHELIVKNKKNYRGFIIIGIIWGLFPFWQSHIFIGLGLIFLTLPLFLGRGIKQFLLLLIVGATISLPQLFWLSKDIQNFFAFNPGYLSLRPLTIMNFISYWFFNLGLSLITIPLGFLMAKKEQKYIFIAFMGIFLIANLFQFNKEIFNNHKFFNFWLTFANFYSAFFLINLIKKKIGLILFPVIVFLLTFSGIIDFMVIKNEPYFLIEDFPKNKLISWVKYNTPPKSIFLVPQDEMYHPIRMAGRKTFQYMPRYAWAYGYNVETRDILIKKIYESNDISEIKSLLTKNNINYILLPKKELGTMHLKINYSLFNLNFGQVLSDDNIEILDVK